MQDALIISKLQHKLGPFVYQCDSYRGIISKLMDVCSDSCTDPSNCSIQRGSGSVVETTVEYCRLIDAPFLHKDLDDQKISNHIAEEVPDQSLIEMNQDSVNRFIYKLFLSISRWISEVISKGSQPQLLLTYPDMMGNKDQESPLI